MDEDIDKAFKDLLVIFLVLGGLCLVGFAALSWWNDDRQIGEKAALSAPVVPSAADCCLIPANRGLYGRGVPR